MIRNNPPAGGNLENSLAKAKTTMLKTIKLLQVGLKDFIDSPKAIRFERSHPPESAQKGILIIL